jgi:hypothetical protein
LSDAYLLDADLHNANFGRAIITEQQLAASQSLVGATMPNGERFRSATQRGRTVATWVGIVATILGAIFGLLLALVLYSY